MTNKLTVTLEKREIRFLVRPRIAGKVFCGECERKVRWLAPEEAMAAAGITLREVFRLVETGELHFAENADGFLIVCAESLADKKQELFETTKGQLP